MREKAFYSNPLQTTAVAEYSLVVKVPLLIFLWWRMLVGM
jgi:hypothetical protein